uniref:Uncharacterized protein n=1 Tax=Oryza rufipogon TaxID=4529 RepID=A0A0E0NQP4_ORYRU
MLCCLAALGQQNDDLAKPNRRFPPNQVLAGQFKRYADTLSLERRPHHLPSRHRQQRRDKRTVGVDGSVRNEDGRKGAGAT